MAASLRPLFLAIIPLLMISSLISSSECQGLGFYWGENPHAGNLTEICLNGTGTYEYVAIAFLNFEGSKTVLSIDDHCNPSIPDKCASLGPMIDFCKGQGIKVFLSLGGRPDLSPDDAQKVADDIWNNFLNNSAGHGPLNATVDGIDFHIQSGSNQNLDVLAQALSAYSTPDKKVYLSAAPLCQIPDDYLDAAIRTGVFDYVWVQFFDDPSCEYRPESPSPLITSWIAWSCYLDKYNTTLFLGLTGDSDADGYIPCVPLVIEILLFVERFPKYGGIMMLQGKYYCLLSSEKIRSYVNSDVMAYGRKSMNKFQAI
ncbi:acidic endochitinase-like [Coffea eugenioides]|uniref:acidic endochitinase-like n=1 Tax=Coffea eugenioides TaxID=49369 RepID=UPI000F61250A|nr:acidic endochitinase-like [Coffea eugenioides]